MPYKAIMETNNCKFGMVNKNIQCTTYNCTLTITI